MDGRHENIYGVTASVYYCRKGEGLPLHGHSKGVTHGHMVIRGATRVEVEGEETRVQLPNNGNIELPPDKKHAIIAMIDDTIFVNVISNAALQRQAGDLPPEVAGPPAPHINRVMMCNGTVVEAP